MNVIANATPTQPNSQTEEPIVTRDTAGALRCTCKRFKVNAMMFGEGACDHTTAVELALAGKGGAQ